MHSEKKKNRFEIDMCNGSIMNKLISFSIPLMISGILQLAFNAVDIVVVGSFCSSITTGSFHCNAIPGCPGNVSEVCDGTSTFQTGKRLVPIRFGIVPEQYGKLGDPMQSGLAGTCLLADS